MNVEINELKLKIELSRTAVSALGLIELIIREIDGEMFGDLGTLGGEPINFRLKDGAQPCVNLSRCIPIPLISYVEQELNRMGEACLIIKVKQNLLIDVSFW